MIDEDTGLPTNITHVNCIEDTSPQIGKMKKIVKQAYGIYYEKSLPGEECTDDENCYSNGCVDGVCVGQKHDEICLTHQNCGVGLYCSSATQTCEPQVNVGGMCDDDKQCVNWALCEQHVCLEKFSLVNGEKLYNGWNQELCKSNFTSFCHTEVSWTCYPGAVLNSSSVRGVKDDQTCYYNRVGLKDV